MQLQVTYPKKPFKQGNHSHHRVRAEAQQDWEVPELAANYEKAELACSQTHPQACPEARRAPTTQGSSAQRVPDLLGSAPNQSIGLPSGDIGKADARSQGRSFRGERGQQLSANQNQGFERLMDAIAGLRASSSASNTPIHSPPHKVAKGS